MRTKSLFEWVRRRKRSRKPFEAGFFMKMMAVSKTMLFNKDLYNFFSD